MPKVSRRLVLLGLGLGLLSGCGGGADAPVTVQGQVTLDGQPVGGDGGGVIRFSPAGPGRGAEAVVRNGQYTVKVLPGDYKVSVNWPKSTGKKLNPDATGPGSDAMEMIEAVPAKYNTATVLTQNITPDGGRIDFSLVVK